MGEEVEIEEKPKGKVRHINKKRVAGVLVTGGIFVGSISFGCYIIRKVRYASIPNIDSCMTNVVYKMSNQTVYDSLYIECPMYLVDDLEISSSEYEIISKLDLDIYYSEDLKEQEAIFNKEELTNLVNRYKELKSKVDFKTPNADTNEFYLVVAKLISCRNQFTKDIYIDGVELINDISTKYIKALVIDSLGLTINDINNVSVLPFYTENRELLIKYTDINSGKVYYLEANKYSLLYELINNLIELNELNDKYLTGELKNINKLASKEDITLRNLKACVLCNYEIKNGVINQKETCKELVKKID